MLIIYGMEECEACQHGTRFSQGMYCFVRSRYISETEAYSSPCGQFSTLTSESRINNAIALLEECIHNGERGSLYAWFAEERQLIENTIRDLKEEEIRQELLKEDV